MGYLKDTVSSERIDNIEQLKSKITSAIRGFDTNILENVWQTLETRLNFIIRVNSGILENLLKVKKLSFSLPISDNFHSNRSSVRRIRSVYDRWFFYQHPVGF